MSASMLDLDLRWRPATVADADALLAIEQRAYSHPWSRGNFIDSLAGGHWAWCATLGEGPIRAYWLAMQVLDEVHLLNLAVAPECWGLGLGRGALQHLHQTVAAQGLQDIWLEVRESNLRAQRLYEAADYQTVGRRRGYYPADAGREDALLMRRGGVGA